MHLVFYNKALKLLIRIEQKFWVCFSVYDCVVCVTTEYEVLASLLTSGRIELPSISRTSWFFHCFLQLTSFLPNKMIFFFWHCSKLALHFLYSCEKPLPEMCSWLYKMTLLILMQPNHILTKLAETQILLLCPFLCESLKWGWLRPFRPVFILLSDLKQLLSCCLVGFGFGFLFGLFLNPSLLLWKF